MNFGQLLCRLGFHKPNLPVGGARSLYTSDKKFWGTEIYQHCTREVDENGHLREVNHRSRKR